jgi:hypothetical protein
MKPVKSPHLSVIVAVGNYTNFLTTYLASVSCQNIEEVEFIFVFDTPDSSLNPSQLFKGISFEFETVVGNFGSPGLARNAGLNLANGKWISFNDIDDLTNITGLLGVVRETEESDAYIGCGIYRTLDFGSHTLLEECQWSNKPFADLIRRPGLWRMVFRADVIADKRFSNLSMGEDQLFLVSIGFPLHPIHFSNQHVYDYMKNVPGQLTSLKSKKQELTKAIRLELCEAIKYRHVAVWKFTLKLVLRQIMTVLKHGILLDKLRFVSR